MFLCKTNCVDLSIATNFDILRAIVIDKVVLLDHIVLYFFKRP